jgi:outer membrane protein OmpA-like peptidoglycan-associated protein
VNEGEKLQLIALTDAASSNPQLLIDRAQAVKTYLVKLGIKPSRITIQTE